MATRTCACGCGKAIPPDAHANRKYFDDKCVNRAQQRRYRARKRRQEGRPDRYGVKSGEDQSTVYISKDESEDGRASARRGPGYEYIVRNHEADFREFVAGRVTRTRLAEKLDPVWPHDMPNLSGSNLSRWAAAFVEDEARGVALADFEPDLSHTEDLGSFTRRYFPKLLVPDFHMEWEADIDEVVGTGNRLLIVGPQRFGKSEMLIRYCMRRIALDPNISIGWVSKTASLAERMVGYVRQNLEHNTKFIHDVVGPGQTFVPPTRSGYSWTNGEFTVATRTEVRKSPTMEALGVGGTIAGKDFDLIILDDPQDRVRCLSPTQREKDSEWMFTDFLSRKEEHTGVAFIMSRQHIDDLPGQIIRDHMDDWEVRIYRAHDPACTIPDHEVDAHVDCLLWPKKRSWKWLYHQKQANPAHFERNYQQNPTTDKMTLVTAADLDEITDPQRRVGEWPESCRLVAGIDPASAKPVAATLWAWSTKDHRRHLVDTMMAAPGSEGVVEVLTHFHATYGCRMFMVETNGYQKVILEDRSVKELKHRLGLQLFEHYTSRSNKADDSAGVVAWLQQMRGEDPKFSLPAASDHESAARIEQFKRQLLLFDPDYAHHKHAQDDLVMAGWFPQLRMDLWERTSQDANVIEFEFRPTGYATTEWGGYQRTGVL